MTVGDATETWPVPLLTFDDLVHRHSAHLAGPKLNLGCGWDVRPGHVNADIAALPGVDTVLRPDEALPFDDSSFEVVLAKDVIEHVADLGFALGEIHRVLRPGGVLLVSTVHFTSRDVYVDPTHRRGFSIRTLDFFVAGAAEVDRGYYVPFAFSAVEDAHIQFHAQMGKGRYLVWERVVEPVINVRPWVQDVYEITGVSRLFPAGNILVALRK